jgi:hypothetical protein
VNAGGGILVPAIRRLEQVFDGLRQLSRSEPAGRAFKRRARRIENGMALPKGYSDSAGKC